MYLFTIINLKKLKMGGNVQATMEKTKMLLHFVTIKQVSRNEIKEVDEANIYVYSDSDTIYNIQTTLCLPLNPSDIIDVNYNDFNMPSVIYMAMMGSILIPI